MQAFLSGVMTMFWNNLDVTGHKMLRQANALSSRMISVSLESQLQKSHSPVYGSAGEGRQAGRLGSTGRASPCPAQEVKEELAFVFRDPEHGTLNWDMLTVTTLTTE